MSNVKPLLIYPKAVWTPLFDHSAPGKLSDRDTIVLHITQGSTAAGAIATFKASKTPNRVSCHFVIGRGEPATVYQLLSLDETAWHASQVNWHSIGIEHVAMAQSGGFPAMPATYSQYEASAELVAWLCVQMGVPCDRAHVRTHNEVSPRDGHVLCCTGALDPDYVVKLAADLLNLGH